MEKGGWVYIITNSRHTVLYTGVTSDLIARMCQHKTKQHTNSFSAKYNCHKLVYYKSHATIEDAIDAEKQIKAGSRHKKMDLINAMNPSWRDLYDELF